MRSRWLWLCALAAAACTEPRQIVLSIRTTAGVPCDIDTIRLVMKAAGTTTVEQRLHGAHFPVEIPLLDDTPGGNFQIEISGIKDDVEVMRVNGTLQFRGRRAVEPVLLEPRCTPDAPCTLDDAMAAGEGAPDVGVLACANVNRYQASPALEGFESACTVPGARKVLVDGSRLVKLTELDPELAARLAASGFQFYGRPIRQIWIAKDGYVSFTEVGPEPRDQVPPGSFDREIVGAGVAPPRQSAMAFWDTLSLSSSGVCYAIDGAPGSQRLRVTWAHACLTQVCTTDNLNFTIAIDEIDNHVAITYGAMIADNDPGAHGINATAGLVSDATGCPADRCVLATGRCEGDGKPCGYSQVFSKELRLDGVPSMQFVPIVDPP